MCLEQDLQFALDMYQVGIFSEAAKWLLQLCANLWCGTLA